jgi:hypothetical protein
MGTTADDLREQVDANRSSAEDKINKIEQQVTEQAQAIQEKVSGAGEMIQEKVTDTAQQVKEQFNWRKQVDDRPLVAVGAAMIGGMLLGKMMGGDGGNSHRHAPDAPHSGAGMMAGGGMIAGALQNAFQKSGLSDQLETTMHDLFSTVTSRMKDMTKDLPGVSSSGGSQSGSGSSASGSGSSGSGSTGNVSSGSMGDLSRTYGSAPERSTSAV